MAARLDIYCLCILNIISVVNAGGLMLLYRPKDVSNECANSRQLRYDLTFGMGMSDTITLVFRTLSETDYECSVDIAAQDKTTELLVVIRYPNSFRDNCAMNQEAFTVIRNKVCLKLCDQPWRVQGNYLIMQMRGRMRFRFVSNSSVNNDMNVNMYQVTVTAARRKPPKGCFNWNETLCIANGEEYCFTTGVVCDGIKNCGVSDWFDERISDCLSNESTLGFAPVVAVIAAVMCCLLAASHVLMKCLPPLAQSFFIFNANEDNRLYIDSVYKTTGTAAEVKLVRCSITTDFSSSSDSDSDDETSLSLNFRNIEEKLDVQKVEDENFGQSSKELNQQEGIKEKRKNTVMNLTRRIQEKLRSISGRSKSTASESVLKVHTTFNV